MRALVSVYDKTGLAELAGHLLDRGYQIISSGGTYRYLSDLGLAVTEVSQMTGFPEMLSGRVKTLHPAVHGGILARRHLPEDLAQLVEQGIEPIDLVCCNLYPFTDGLARQVSDEEQVELIDIGGPTMLRSAAKNFASVTVLSDPKQYPEFIQRDSDGSTDEAYRRQLAAAVFARMSAYDGAVARYLTEEVGDFLPLSYEKVQDLRYGENPHQKATFYRNLAEPGFLTDFKLLAGKELSYINLADVDAAYSVVLDFDEPCVCAVKHNTPCGVAVGDSIAEAYHKAYQGDPISIFGGIIAANRMIDQATAEQMVQIFLEVVVAPEFSPEALEVFKQKPNVRLVEICHAPATSRLLRSVNGGMLVQEADLEFSHDFETVTKRLVSDQEMTDLLFAMKVVKHVRSNAIVIVKDGQTLGIGGGQTNRIDAARLALRTAVPGSVLGSDAFFPFDDVVRAAHEAGVVAIIQPGGSIQDQKSIDACDELGLTMVMTGRRHFKH